MMEPNTIHYFPPHISSIEEFKQIAKVYDKYLTMVWKDLDQIRANQHFDEMRQNVLGGNLFFRSKSPEKKAWRTGEETSKESGCPDCHTQKRSSGKSWMPW